MNNGTRLEDEHGLVKYLAEFDGAPLYIMNELVPLKCHGCCFEKDWLTSNANCAYRGRINCGNNRTICVRDMDVYRAEAVAVKLVGVPK